MFVHSDELVYSKLCHILWKNPELYKQVILLMGGFHQLRVMQKILYKRYNCRQIQQICVEAEVIAKGSSDQAFEGRHYYRCLRVHKECFDALVQLRIERLTDNHRTTAPDLLVQLQTLRRFPSSANLDSVMKSIDFGSLCSNILNFGDGTEEHLTIKYLKYLTLRDTYRQKMEWLVFVLLLITQTMPGMLAINTFTSRVSRLRTKKHTMTW